jgi:hypothetical protein
MMWFYSFARTGPAMAGCLMLLSICCRSEPATTQGPIEPARNKELLEVLARAEEGQNMGEILKEFADHPKEERLGVLAYALEEMIHTTAALQVIIDDEGMRDPRLASFLARTIDGADGKVLLLAARAAKHLPAPILLPGLIDKCLGSEYLEVHTVRTERHYERYYHSVFAEAAEALYSITDGKIGSEKVRRDIMMSEEERKGLIEEWRRRWREGWLSCRIDFEEPLRNPPGISVDRKPFIGEWELIREGGGKVEAGKSHVSVSQVEDGTLTVTCEGEDGQRKARALLLTSIGQRKIGSVQVAPDRWRLYQLDLQDEGPRLVVKGLDWAELKEDVLSGVLAGKVVDPESGGACQGIRITASGEEVRSYIEQRRNVFRVEHVYARCSP